MLSELTRSFTCKWFSVNEFESLQKYYSAAARQLLLSGSDVTEHHRGPNRIPAGGRPSSMATVNLMYGRKHQRGVNWITVIAMTAFHIGAIAALFSIDYGAMAVAFVLYVIAGSWGIGMAYHRLLTHRSYKTHKWIEYFLTICGTLALEGGP